MVGARVARITIMIVAEVVPETDRHAVALLETKSNNSLVKTAKVAQIEETLIMTSARVVLHQGMFNLHLLLADETTLEKVTRKLTTTGAGKRATITSLLVIKADIKGPIAATRVREIKENAVDLETIDEEVIRRLAKVAVMLNRDWVMNLRLQSQELIKLSKKARMTVEAAAKKAHCLLRSPKQMTTEIDQTRTTADAETSPLKTVVATRAKKVRTILNLVIKVEDVTLEAQRREHRVINLGTTRKAVNNRKLEMLIKSLTTLATTKDNNSLSSLRKNKGQTRTTGTAGLNNLCRSRGKGP